MAPMTETAFAPTATTSRVRLWTEFLALFVGVPILMAVFWDEIAARKALFGIVWLLAAVSVLLLWRTPGFSFRTLLRGPVLSEWPIILTYFVVTAATCVIFVLVVAPESFLSIPTYRPNLWIAIMILYPLLSALPQELIFRSLFFERYGVLFPTPAVLLLANGLVFGIGHLFYMNWITIAMTAIGGTIMGWAYMRNRSVALAWVLHAIAGNIIFTVGLGRYFYHGAIG